MPNTKAYDVVTNRILESLHNGVVPWRRPWGVNAGTLQHNAASKKPYRGINQFVLNLSGYTDPRWASFNQIKSKGGKVRKGERGTPVVFWKWIEYENENSDGETTTKTVPILRYYTVFNVTQADGLDLAPIDKAEEFDPVDKAEQIIRDMPNKPPIDHKGGDRAYYVPRLDQIHLPPRASFDGAGEYYSTVFHELGHSTGHKSRVGRKTIADVAPFGSEAYSREELVAEFTSAFLCNVSGIENTVENSAAYIQGWLKVLKGDPKMAVVGASQAHKAADYILGGE